MSAPISFTIRPPSRPSTPSSSSAPSSTANSREQSATPDEPRSGLPPRQGIRISAAPSRPSPLGPSHSAPRSGAGVRDKYGRMTFNRGEEGESDDDEDGNFRGKGRGKARDEEIVGFGEGGAESKSAAKPKGPLVIPSLPNKDWRQSSMSNRKPTYIPESRRGVVDTTVEREGDEPVRAGLQLVSHDDTNNAPVPPSDVPPPASNHAETPSVPETIEQRAMRELMITAENGGEEANAHSDMVIGLQDDTLNLRDMPVDETDAYRRDVLTRPEVSTLDDYSEVPIEAFGEAMLRGMGWRPDAPSAAPGVHAPQRRPEGLGLGATPRAAPLDDKGKKAKRKEDAKSRGGRGYVPVVKRERDTPTDSRNGSPATSSSMVRSRATSRSPSPRSEDSRRRREKDDRGKRRDDYDSDRRDRYEDRTRSERKDRERERDSGSRSDTRDRTRDRDRDVKPSRYEDRDRERHQDDRVDGYRRSVKREDKSDRREDRGSEWRERDRR